jgi:hypothetical protein
MLLDRDHKCKKWKWLHGTGSNGEFLVRFSLGAFPVYLRTVGDPPECPKLTRSEHSINATTGWISTDFNRITGY